MKEMEQSYGNKFQTGAIQAELRREKKARERRQVDEQEGSGDSEPLLTEDPKGWGLAHVLGWSRPSRSVLTIKSCRDCFSHLSLDIHSRHHLQAHQDAPGDIREGRPSLSQIQVAPPDRQTDFK